jgi:flagellar motor switch protein FliM
MTGGIGEQAEPIQFVFPYAMLEPLLRLLSPSLPGAETVPAPSQKLRWNPEFDDVPVPVIAEWHGLTMSAGEISRLKVGDLLGLDPACAAQVQIRLNDVPKFTGRPGTSAGKWAVQLTGDINP